MTERLHGCVVAVSEVLRLKFGETVFVEIRLIEGSSVHILMTGTSVTFKHGVKVGNCITLMKNAKKFRWKESGSNDNLNAQCVTYLMINTESQLQSIHNKLCSHCQPYRLQQKVLQAQLMGISKGLFLPNTTFEREQHSRQEFTVEGVFLAQSLQLGYIQLSLSQNGEETSTTSTSVFCPHGKLLLCLANLRVGSLLRVFNVLPVYLWGIFRGFSCTVRSSVEVLETNITTQMTSKPPRCLRTLRSACVLYTVWMVETRRRLARALVCVTKGCVVQDVICDALENVSGRFDENSHNSDSFHNSRLPNTSCDSLDATCVQQYLALAPQCIQNEFRDAAYAQLHQIRSGQDADWLGGRLPEVWTCTRLRRAAIDCARRFILQSGVSQKQVYNTHIEDLCRLSAQLQGLPVLVGSLRSVEMARSHCPGQAVLLSLVDGTGCEVSMVVRAIGVEFHAFLIKQVCGDSCTFSGAHERVTYSFDHRGESPFAVLLPRPSCCLIEEHPLHDEQSCGLTVMTCEKELLILTTSKNTETKEQTQWSCSAQDEAFSGPVRDDTWKASSGQQIRDLLAVELSLGGASHKCTAFGLVVSKQIILDDFSRAATHQNPQKAQRRSGSADRSWLHKKCKVTLRDVRYPDCIVVYMTLVQAASLVVGSAVQISDCQLVLPESRKKPYLRLDGDTHGASIDVVGFCNVETLRALCAECNRIASGRRDFAQGVGAISPPPISIAQLSSISRHNRCLWSVVGQVVFVRRIFISLRCSVCQSHASAIHGVFKCSRCDSVHNIAPLWEAVVVLGDGSGEADLHLEGTDVHRAVRSRVDRGGVDWRKVVSLVERSVRQTGKLVFDPFAARLSVHEELEYEALEDLLWNNFDEQVAIVDTHVPDPSSALKAYLRGCSFATHFRVVCSVNFYQHQQMNNGPSTRRINLQEINKDFPYRSVFVAMPTAAAPRLNLEAFGLTELRTEETRLAAWTLLTQIEEKF